MAEVYIPESRDKRLQMAALVNKVCQLEQEVFVPETHVLWLKNVAEYLHPLMKDSSMQRRVKGYRRQGHLRRGMEALTNVGIPLPIPQPRDDEHDTSLPDGQELRIGKYKVTRHKHVNRDCLTIDFPPLQIQFPRHYLLVFTDYLYNFIGARDDAELPPQIAIGYRFLERDSTDITPFYLVKAIPRVLGRYSSLAHPGHSVRKWIINFDDIVWSGDGRKYLDVTNS